MMVALIPYLPPPGGCATNKPPCEGNGEISAVFAVAVVVACVAAFVFTLWWSSR